jgi:hypothetical protein
MANSRFVFSCGGGVQSSACLVLAAQKVIPYRTFIFANVGNRAEDPRTIAYIQKTLKPYAAAHGIEWIDVQRRRRDGTPVDLYDELLRPETRSVGIPVRMKRSGAPGRRSCTVDFKILPIAKWIKRNAPGCTLGKGISTDEPHRATPTRETDCYTSAYPLIELGYSRTKCLAIVADAGLPQPPKSACWFCPYTSTDKWTILRQERPELFKKAADLERFINQKLKALGRDEVFMSSAGQRRLLPLESAIPNQPGLFPEWIDEQDGCESGYCMT